MSNFFAEAFNEIFRQWSSKYQVPTEHQFRQMEFEAWRRWFSDRNETTARLRCRSIRTKRQ